jgi:restriction system protein
MFKEPIEPTFKVRNAKLVFRIFVFGIILMLFASTDVFLFLLGIFLFCGAIVIILFESYFYQQKLYKHRKKVRKIKDSHIFELDKFSGEKFEFYLKKMFEDLGYQKIQTTKKTRDFGVDLIMFDSLGKKIVIQAKRYSGNIGIDAINEAVGTRLPEHASEVWVVTNSFFTKPAIEHATKNGVRLINRDLLIELIIKAKKSQF